MTKKYTRGAEEQYKEMRRIEKRMPRKKRRFYEEQIKQAENLHTQKESRTSYRLANYIRKEFRPPINACRDSNGLTLNETVAIMNR
jgi:flagellar biosynthesis GTPase FlhF